MSTDDQTPALQPGTVVDALSIGLSPVDDSDGGSGLTGIAELSDSVGVWEMHPGVDEDTEEDEVFVVLSGAGTVEFPEDDSLPTITLQPGSVVRLTEGMRTRWTVTETLRKVYVA